MNRGRVTPKPQQRVIFGFPLIQVQALAAVSADQTTPGALMAGMGIPRSSFVVPPS